MFVPYGSISTKNFALALTVLEIFAKNHFYKKNHVFYRNFPFLFGFFPNFLTIFTENLQTLVQFLTFFIYFFLFFHKLFIFGQNLLKTSWDLKKNVCFPKRIPKKSFSYKLDSSSKFLIKYLAFIFNFSLNLSKFWSKTHILKFFGFLQFFSFLSKVCQKCEKKSSR